MKRGVLPYHSVLVTGASGFVGRHLVSALRAHLEPDALLLCPGRSMPGEAEPLDLLDAGALHRILAKSRPDLIFHLAAQSSVAGSASAAADTWQTNVTGTLNLARAVAEIVPGATFGFASSSEVYGAAFNAGPVSEDTTPLPLSPYARTKRAGEQMLDDVLAPTNRLVVFRPGNHSGVGQDQRFVLPAFADQIAAIEAGLAAPVVQVGSLTAERDFLDVRDVVHAYILVLSQAASAARETFNIASGEVRPIRYLLEQLLAMTRLPVTIEQDAARFRPSDIPIANIDATKLREQTGWRPRHPFGETIADVLEDRRRHYRTRYGLPRLAGRD